MFKPFKLEQEIEDWRRQMAAGGLGSPQVLDELESHLRGEIRMLISTGTRERGAFRLAGLIASNNRIAGCWPLNAVLGINLFLLAFGLLPQFGTAKTRGIYV
jgi:hypothetical protein